MALEGWGRFIFTSRTSVAVGPASNKRALRRVAAPESMVPAGPPEPGGRTAR